MPFTVDTPNGRVIRGHWEYGWDEAIPRLIAEMLGETIPGTIRVTWRKLPSELEEADFYVLIYASPDGTNRRYYDRGSPTMAFGDLGVDTDYRAKPSGKGVQIKDEAGVVWAEIVDNALYILHLINYKETRRELALMRKILEVALPYLKPLCQWHPGEQTDDLTKHVFAQSMGTVGERIQELQHASDGAQERLARERDSIGRRAQEVQLCASELAVLNALDQEQLKQEASADLARLAKDPRVVSIDANRDYLFVYTTELWAWVPGKKMRYRIGRYLLRIPLSGDSTDLAIFALRYRIQSHNDGWRHAPHVSNKGALCWGNTAETFNELLIARDYIGVAHELFAFLTNVNLEDSWGKEIPKWPEDQRPEDSTATRAREALVAEHRAALKYLTPEIFDHWLMSLSESQLASLKELIPLAQTSGTNWEVVWVAKNMAHDVLFSKRYRTSLVPKSADTSVAALEQVGA